MTRKRFVVHWTQYHKIEVVASDAETAEDIALNLEDRETLKSINPVTVDLGEVER